MFDNPLHLGYLLLAIGAVCGGSFGLPSKFVKKDTPWEVLWGPFFLFATILLPILCGPLLVGEFNGTETVVEDWQAGGETLVDVYRQTYETAGWLALALPFLIGILWGLGSMTLGLSFAFIGLSLAYAINYGGQIIVGLLGPILLHNPDALQTTYGHVILGGAGVCLVGVAVCAWAGVLKSRDQSGDAAANKKKGASILLGLSIAILSGALCACWSIAFSYGEGDGGVYDSAIAKITDVMEGNEPVVDELPTDDAATDDAATDDAATDDAATDDVATDDAATDDDSATDDDAVAIAPVDEPSTDEPAANAPVAEAEAAAPIYKWKFSIPTTLLILFGGSLSACFYCFLKLTRNRTWHKFFSFGAIWAVILALVMAVLHDAAVIFFGMGAMNLGDLGGSVGYAVFMSLAIITGNINGFWTGEWRGAKGRSIAAILIGIIILLGGVGVLGKGLMMKTDADKASAAAAPVVEDPVVEDPVVEDPVVEDPVVEDPVVEDPVTDDPTTDDPVTLDPFAEDPVTEEPVTEDPVTLDPFAEDPVMEEPTIDEPVVDEPVVDEPVMEDLTDPVPDTETDGIPVLDPPTIGEPVIEDPVIEEPTIEEPAEDDSPPIPPFNP